MMSTNTATLLSSAHPNGHEIISFRNNFSRVAKDAINKVSQMKPSSRFQWFWCCSTLMVLFLVMALWTTDFVFVPLFQISTAHRHSTLHSKQQQQNGNNYNNNTGVSSRSTIRMTTTGSTSPTTFAFRYRADPKLSDDARLALAQTWGRWSVIKDPKASQRRPALPCILFAAVHCDVPRIAFPSNVWQSDPTFLEPFLSQAQALVTRAQEAILAEYGQSKFDLPNKTFLERSANFQLDVLALDDDGAVHPPKCRQIVADNGGWTTSRSSNGLVRRLLHAIMTQDTFTFALGGHSIAAAHGNHFRQSYAMQFHRTMEPVLGRLGVQLYSYNFAKGGLGTMQDSLGMGSLWGKEIDICMWDSKQTEHQDSYYDLFARQALISGNRVPILWNGYENVLEDLYHHADVDIGGVGSGLRGLPITESDEQAATLPYAVRYLKCSRDAKDLCEAQKYNAKCWLNRSDVTPPTNQDLAPSGRGTFHPGFRSNRLTGRVLAFTILTALQEALTQWQNAPNYTLPDSAWHVTEYYQNIRTKLSNLTTTPCFHDPDMPSPRVCYTPMKAVSEYTPRIRPDQTSIRSIVTDTSYIPAALTNIYDGPDVYNAAFESPEGEVNYLAIVENDDQRSDTNGRQLLLSSNDDHREPALVTTSNQQTVGTTADGPDRRLDENSALTIGRGWGLFGIGGDIHCNGTYDSECGRHAQSTCLLYGSNDWRGGLLFDSFSGWMLMRLNGVQKGLIIIKLETWQLPNDHTNNTLTEAWTEENNGTTTIGRRLVVRNTNPTLTSVEFSESNTAQTDPRLRLQRRQLKRLRPHLCPEFMFDYAINGNIQSLSADEFLNKRKTIKQMMETWTLLDDATFNLGKKENGMNVELGIRIRGCQRRNMFKLTHVYWA